MMFFENSLLFNQVKREEKVVDNKKSYYYGDQQRLSLCFIPKQRFCSVGLFVNLNESRASPCNLGLRVTQQGYYDFSRIRFE